MNPPFCEMGSFLQPVVRATVRKEGTMEATSRACMELELTLDSPMGKSEMSVRCLRMPKGPGASENSREAHDSAHSPS